MARQPKPWFRKSRGVWYVCLGGKQHNLGTDREQAYQRFYALMNKPKPARVNTDAVVAIIDLFLEWTHRHRAAATYEWYRARTQSFIDTITPKLRVSELKPFHVQQWVDSHDTWSDGMKRGAIIAVQRAFRWATKMGHIEQSPVAHIEKPRAGRRDTIVTPDEYVGIQKLVNDDEFRDLLTVAWETGSRPQELLRVEARHVDLPNARWVIPQAEAKIKKFPRIVYLTDTALAITQRLMLKWPEGTLFRNTRGVPWCPYSVNCRFGRLKKKLGKKYCLYLFRHSFATRLLQAGVDALTVSILLGHCDVSMLAKTYQHLSHHPEYLRGIVMRCAS